MILTNGYLARNEETTDLQSFNLQQRRALALEALTERGIVLIQGPPGTGKSHIACFGFLPQIVARNEKVLVVCNSNVAVDALMLKCHKSESLLKDRIIRCGYKNKISDEIVNLGLYAEGDVASTQNQDRYGNLPGANSNTSNFAVQSQIRSKQVVFTTIHFASKEKGGNYGTESYWNFDTLILDEAGQIEDSRLFIVLARCPSLKKIILVGDPKQLQPYVSDSLRRQGYGKSSMERIMESTAPQTDTSAPYVMLEEQFRMTPLLRQIVSELYYDGRLTDGQNVLSRGPVSSVNLQAVLVVNLTGTSMVFNRLLQSFENESEARVVNVVLDFLFSSDFEGVLPGRDDLTTKDVCVLTPYNRHKDRLRMEICEIDEADLDYGGETFGNIGSPTGGTQSQVLFGTQEDVSEDSAALVKNIDTVDKFQGSERKVVIISTCVDKKPKRAADPHFINVACSRAQHLLIIVGNFKNGLASNDDWTYVCTHAKENGSYIEHHVTISTTEDDDDDDYFEIHEESLISKLRDLVERPSQRRRHTKLADH